ARNRKRLAVVIHYRSRDLTRLTAEDDFELDGRRNLEVIRRDLLSPELYLLHEAVFGQGTRRYVDGKVPRPDRPFENELACRVGPCGGHGVIALTEQRYAHSLELYWPVALGDADPAGNIRRRTHGNRHTTQVRGDHYASAPISL